MSVVVCKEGREWEGGERDSSGNDKSEVTSEWYTLSGSRGNKNEDDMTSRARETHDTWGTLDDLFTLLILLVFLCVMTRNERWDTNRKKETKKEICPRRYPTIDGGRERKWKPLLRPPNIPLACSVSLLVVDTITSREEEQLTIHLSLELCPVKSDPSFLLLQVSFLPFGVIVIRFLIPSLSLSLSFTRVILLVYCTLSFFGSKCLSFPCVEQLLLLEWGWMWRKRMRLGWEGERREKRNILSFFLSSWRVTGR